MRIVRGALAALAIGLAPLAGAPARAQVIVPQAEGDAAIDHMQQATAAAQRITALLVAVANDPAYAAAADVDEVRAAIASMRGDIAAARGEIRTIAGRLRALPPVSGPSDPAELRIVDQVVSDIADFAGETDQFLATIEQLGEALDAGQDARAAQLAASLVKGSIAIVDAQALMLRARLPMIPSDSSSFAQVTSLACFYDGFAALQTGAFEIVKPTEAAAEMDRAHACMVDNIALGRAAIEREASTEHGNSTLNAIRDGLVPVHRAMFDELTVGAELLAGARAALARGEGLGVLTAYGVPTTTFEERFQTLVTREVEVVRRQGR